MAHLPYVISATCTNGSQTVSAGLGAFLINVLPGDWLRGPDEKLYFVNAVPSNTSLTLDRAYLGSTVTTNVSFAKHSEQWSSNAQSAALLAQLLTSFQAGFAMQSTASLAIGTGTKVFSGATAGLPILNGARLRASSRANPANYMDFTVTDYTGNTITGTVVSGDTGGSGTFADWNINIVGAKGATGGTFTTVTKGAWPAGDGTNVGALLIGNPGQTPIADPAATYGMRWANCREFLTAGRTYYVNGAGGSDSNDGLSVGAAFATLTKVASVIAALDLAVFNVTVNIADATYTAGFSLSAAPPGSGTITLVGNTTTPANCIIAPSGVAMSASGGANFTISGMEIRSTGSSGVSANGFGSKITVGTAVRYGTCAVYQNLSSNGGIIFGRSNYSIVGNGLYHKSAQYEAVVDLQTMTVTLTGTPAFTAFCLCIFSGFTAAAGITYSGSATGVRYTSSTGGGIYTGGAGANYFPGNSAGSATTPGWYI